MIHLWGIKKDPNFITKWFWTIHCAYLGYSTAVKIREQQKKNRELEIEMHRKAYLLNKSLHNAIK